jgi:hypothetical protein
LKDRQEETGKKIKKGQRNIKKDRYTDKKTQGINKCIYLSLVYLKSLASIKIQCRIMGEYNVDKSDRGLISRSVTLFSWTNCTKFSKTRQENRRGTAI